MQNKTEQKKKESPGKNRPKRDHAKTAKTEPQHVDETKRLMIQLQELWQHLSGIADRYERM